MVRNCRWYSEVERAAFFVRYDKGGSVRSIAVELGFDPSRCYKWCRDAGFSSGRSTPRQYSVAEQEALLVLLRGGDTVSHAARMLGFHRAVCYKWAHEAGIFGSRFATKASLFVRREQFLDLRAQGHSRDSARQFLGVDKRTASDWDKGIITFSGGRIYRDGRVIRYTSREKIDMVSNPRQRWNRGTEAELEVVEKVIHSRFFSLKEREHIHDQHVHGISLRMIAKQLHRSPSSISREIKRNSPEKYSYLPYTAQRLAAFRRLRPKESKLSTHRVLRDYVQHGLTLKWSPEQISARLITDFPHDTTMRVCMETIYQGLYVQARGGLKREIIASIRSGRTRRHPQTVSDQRKPRFVEPMIMISDRPPEVNDRAIPGHWEGDLIIGSRQRSAIGTLVERTSRYVMLVHLPHDHTAETVRDGLIRTITTLPQQLRQSLTWDQGSEMSEHKPISLATGMNIYFCDPASPWQRGSNENTNGLLRQYFPKGTDLNQYSPQDLQQVANQMNNRPRKTLNWATPNEKIHEILTTPA